MTTKASNVTGPNINPILLISMQLSVKSRAKNRLTAPRVDTPLEILDPPLVRSIETDLLA